MGLYVKRSFLHFWVEQNIIHICVILLFIVVIIPATRSASSAVYKKTGQERETSVWRWRRGKTNQRTPPLYAIHQQSSPRGFVLNKLNVCVVQEYNTQTPTTTQQRLTVLSCRGGVPFVAVG